MRKRSPLGQESVVLSSSKHTLSRSPHVYDGRVETKHTVKRAPSAASV